MQIDASFDPLAWIAAGVLWVLLWAGPVLAFVYSAYLILSLPMRRAERGRLLLDLIEDGLKRGKSPEETIIAVSQTNDASVGKSVHRLAAYLADGRGFYDALTRLPQLLPPQVTAMLKAGERVGDLPKVLPACRQKLRDPLSQTRGALNYILAMAGYFIFPAVMSILTAMEIYVLPTFLDVMSGMSDGASPQLPALLSFVIEYRWALVLIQAVLTLMIWVAVFIYVGGAPLTAWFESSLAPLVHRIHYIIPWRRKRMQRDFSTMLGLLLDADVPEHEAILLAADCSANNIFKRRAQQAATRLQQGVKLTEALAAPDDAGEFRWRLSNAVHAQEGFFQALAGWNQALDAKAFQQEQAAAHVVTTGIVLLNGLVIGTFVVAVFELLANVVNLATTW